MLCWLEMTASLRLGGELGHTLPSMFEPAEVLLGGQYSGNRWLHGGLYGKWPVLLACLVVVLLLLGF